MFVAKSKIRVLVQIALSGVLLIAAASKLLHPAEAAGSLQQLFGGPAVAAKGVVFLLGGLEVALAAAVWWRLPKWALAVPLLFAVVYGYSAWVGADCGCFGAFPGLRELSFPAHVALLAGMFFGMLSLLDRPAARPATPPAPGRRVLLTGLLSLLLIAGAAASLPFTVRPGPAGFTAVDLAYVRRAVETQRAVLVDARSEEQYLYGHIDSAINIPVDAPQLAALIEEYGIKNRQVIAYCAGSYCDMAERLAEKLRAAGCRNVKIYPGGWEEWVQKMF